MKALNMVLKSFALLRKPAPWATFFNFSVTSEIILVHLQ
jgi:hypothetical protein